MPRRYSLAGDLGEAIRRGGAGFAGALEETARQKTEKEQFDQLFGLRTDAADLSRERFEAGQTISESRETRAQQLFDIQHPVGPQLADPLTISDIEDQIAREAFELEGAEGFRSSQRKRFESTRAPAKTTKPKARKTPTLTPLQLKKLVADRREEQTTDILRRADEPDIESLRESSAEGLGRMEDAPGLFTGDQPAPDSTDYRLLQEFEQAISQEADVARADSITSGLLFPELGLGGQGAAQPSLAPTTEIADPVAWARANIDGWDMLTPDIKAAILEKRQRETGQ